jgi:hypothetical protein
MKKQKDNGKKMDGKNMKRREEGKKSIAKNED